MLIGDIFGGMMKAIEKAIDKELDDEKKELAAEKDELDKATQALHTPHPNLSGAAEKQKQLDDFHSFDSMIAGHRHRADRIHHQIEGKREILKIVEQFHQAHKGG